MLDSPWLRFLLLPLLFAALMAGGAQVEIDWGPIPFILSDWIVLLAGLLLGRAGGPLSVGLYLVVGALGTPIFAGGGSGMETLTGSSAGYLWGFLLAAVVISQLVGHWGTQKWPLLLAATAVGQLTFFILGVSWLNFELDLGWAKAIQVGFLDFWFPLTLKLFSSATLAWLTFRFRLFPSPKLT